MLGAQVLENKIRICFTMIMNHEIFGFSVYLTTHFRIYILYYCVSKIST
jgi:hypothetical protein